jgi:microtubule-associated protein-like 1/2
MCQGHIEELWALASHPLKNVFVTGGNDNTIRLWNLTTRQLLRLLSVEDKVKCLAYSPDGSTIAAGLENGMVTKNRFFSIS